MASETILTAARQAYLRGVRRRGRFVTFMRYAILAGVIALWELAAQLGWIDPFITSCPSRVAATIARLAADGELLLHVGVTLFETVAGFLIGTAAGTLIAAAMWWSPAACRILDPYLVVLNALPKIALGPVLIVWIGAGIGSIIVMAVLISLVVTIVTVLTGFLDITGEKQLERVAAARRRGRRDEAVDAAVHILEQVLHQVVPVAEILVEAPAGDAGLVHDAVDRQLRDRHARQLAVDGGEQAVPLLLRQAVKGIRGHGSLRA